MSELSQSIVGMLWHALNWAARDISAFLGIDSLFEENNRWQFQSFSCQGLIEVNLEDQKHLYIFCYHEIGLFYLRLIIHYKFFAIIYVFIINLLSHLSIQSRGKY